MPRNLKFLDYQLEDIARAACHDGVVFSWDTGMGKSLAAFAWPIIKEAKRVLLVAPEGLHDQLRDTNRQFFGVPLVSLPGPNLFAAFGLERPPVEGAKTMFFITSYSQLCQVDADERPPKTEADEDGMSIAIESESLTALRRKYCRRDLRIPYEAENYNGVGVEHGGILCVARPSLSTLIRQYDAFDCVVIDEGVRIQANDSAMAMAVRSLEPKMRMVLTATPIKNRLESFFWLAWWAAGGSQYGNARWPYCGTAEARESFASNHLLSEKFVTREREYAKLTGKDKSFSKRTAKLSNMASLWKLVAPIVLRRRKDELSVMTATKMIHRITVPPGKHQSDAYDYAITVPPQRSGDARSNASALLQELRQIALCPSSPNIRRPSDYILTPKHGAILELVVEKLTAGAQIIIGSPFHAFSRDMKELLESAGVPCCVLDGEVSPMRRGQLSTDFKQRVFPVMIAGIASMGEGNSFEQCHDIVLPGHEWAFDINKQFVDRVWRVTSKGQVNVYITITKGMIDEELHALWAEKSESSALALDGELSEDEVRDIDPVAVMNRVVSTFDPASKSVDEAEILGKWPDLSSRLHSAYLRWSEQHNHSITT